MIEKVALVVPVMKNFAGLAALGNSIDYPVIPIVYNNWDENHGVSKAWNDGFRRAVELGANLVVISNDDVVLHPGSLERLVSWSSHFSITSVNFNEYQEGISFEDANYACFAIHADHFDRYGEFDESFYPAYFEDNDMRYRVRLAGGKEATVLSATATHIGSATQYMHDPVVTPQVFEQNREYYVKKWGGWPGHEQYKTPFNAL